MGDLKNDNINLSIEWYIKNQNIYKALSKKIENILIELIEIEQINFHAIVSREKDITSFSKKIKHKGYENPSNDVTDLAGIRVITYVEEEIALVCKVIEEAFDIDKKNSSDKSDELGEDKVGYKSIHYVAKLKEERLKLPEYRRFKDLFFEIQVRTILQHAWAEIEHDRNYKFSGVLPVTIKRRFKLLAGLLESADREFNAISKEIDEVSKNVRESTLSGDLKIPIDSTSLKEYINTKFKSIINDENFQLKEEVLDALKIFDINTLKELDNIVPKDFVAKYKSIGEEAYSAVGGLIDDLLIIKDYKKFFNEVWTRQRWGMISENDVKLWEIYNLPASEIVVKYKLLVSEDDLPF